MTPILNELQLLKNTIKITEICDGISYTSQRYIRNHMEEFQILSDEASQYLVLKYLSPFSLSSISADIDEV